MVYEYRTCPWAALKGKISPESINQWSVTCSMHVEYDYPSVTGHAKVKGRTRDELQRPNKKQKAATRRKKKIPGEAKVAAPGVDFQTACLLGALVLLASRRIIHHSQRNKKRELSSRRAAG